jgi:hypothetical protein
VKEAESKADHEWVTLTDDEFERLMATDA